MPAIPINEKPFYNTDQIGNSISSNDMWDCITEVVPGVGNVTRRRPALVAFADLGTGVQGDGLFWWDDLQKLIAVSGGRAFDVKQDGSFSDITGDLLKAGSPVIFSPGTDHTGAPWLYMANGKLVYSANGGATVAPTDIDTPAATHVGWIDEKFVGNVSGTNEFLFTDVNDATGFFDNAFWSGANNPIVCSSKGQKLTALLVAWQQVYAWGPDGCQIFQDDGVTPFVNIPGAFIEAGLEAPYSVQRGNNAIFALCVIDGKRVVVLLVGSTPRVVSEPIARVLAEMPAVSDAIGCLISVGGLAIYLLQFPTSGQTWAYDYRNDEWFRWGAWNAAAGQHDNFMGQHSCFAKAWNKHLIMNRVNGQIYELDRNTFTDADRQLVSFRRTGWIDQGMSWNRKRSNQLYIKVKVFAQDDATSPTLLFRWRDDGNPNWSTYMELPLDPNFQGDCLIKLNRMGMYRMRQYEFRLSDNVDLALVAASEMITEMRN